MPEGFDEWLARGISPENVATLRTIIVRVAEQRTLDVVDLLQAWKMHVEKIESDMALPSSDRSVWGAHDFLAALYLRNFLQSGIAAVVPGLRDQLLSMIAEIDDRFVGFTQPDELRRVETVDGRKHLDTEWWWRRIPLFGPAREELVLYSGIGE